MVKIVWAEFAREDFKIVLTYIAQNSTSYTNRYIEKLLARVRQLESFPRLGQMVPEFGMESIRELIEGNYRIVYRINNDSFILQEFSIPQ